VPRTVLAVDYFLHVGDLMVINREAGLEREIAIAKIVGIEGYAAVGGFLRIKPREGSTEIYFRPTTDMNDAMEAAEAVGLLSSESSRYGYALWKTGDVWCVGPFEPWYKAATPALAICAAIEEKAEKGVA